MKQTIRLTESELRNLISESVVKILNEGMYGFPDDCDQIILAYQHDRECMNLYENIIRMLLKKRKSVDNLSFDILVNSSIMKKFQQFVFKKFKQYQDTPMSKNTPYTFREYVANRMLDQIENNEYDNLLKRSNQFNK